MHFVSKFLTDGWSTRRVTWGSQQVGTEAKNGLALIRLSNPNTLRRAQAAHKIGWHWQDKQAKIGWPCGAFTASSSRPRDSSCRQRHCRRAFQQPSSACPGLGMSWDRRPSAANSQTCSRSELSLQCYSYMRVLKADVYFGLKGRAGWGPVSSFSSSGVLTIAVHSWPTASSQNNQLWYLSVRNFASTLSQVFSPFLIVCHHLEK